MSKTVIMLDSRPDGAGGTHTRGNTYTLSDAQADYYISVGLAKRTSTVSEQTGATINGDSKGRLPVGACAL